ncbi:hypothetical protein VN97_g10984 [Penicillium thymicola]|uniref:Uncharacterized protein n=1 Tax=Penicillium thymicola TaxID=293382 RepID=A0AAI9T7Y2_PENTH|nr:hypothetical protein VN97_g10984 [Penicillium thymicola]
MLRSILSRSIYLNSKALFASPFHFLLKPKHQLSTVLQPAPGLASYTLGQKPIISEHYTQVVQVLIYIVHDMTHSLSHCPLHSHNHHPRPRQQDGLCKRN